MSIIKNGCTIIKLKPQETPSKALEHITRANKDYYKVSITIDHKCYYIGRRKTIEECILIRDEMMEQIEQGTFLEWYEKRRAKHPSNQSQRP